MNENSLKSIIVIKPFDRIVVNYIAKVTLSFRKLYTLVFQ